MLIVATVLVTMVCVINAVWLVMQRAILSLLFLGALL